MSDEHDDEPRGEPVAHNRRLFLGLSAAGLASAVLSGCSSAPGVGAQPASMGSGGMGAMSSGGSAAAMPGMAMPGDWPPMPEGAPTSDAEYQSIDIDVQIAEHEIVPGFSIHTLAFNGAVPGPVIRAQQGQWMKVRFQNRTDLNHTIHWHGLTVPYAMDGVPFVTQPPVMPGQEYIYRFRAEPYGTHFYHCHWGTVLHMQSGMYGAFIVESPDDPILATHGYEREYTLVFSAVDTNFMRTELNNMLQRMTRRMRLMAEGRLDSWTSSHFDTLDDMLAAMERGFVPPYMRSRRSRAELPNPDFFTINGKSYPATEPLRIRRGEKIRVRLANAGTVEHYLHLHGHDFLQVCDDGAPLPQPITMNTVRLSPGKTADIIIEGTNPGIWTFHDHDTRRVTNNGMYPGGALTVLAYDGFQSSFTPSIALDE